MNVHYFSRKEPINPISPMTHFPSAVSESLFLFILFLLCQLTHSLNPHTHTLLIHFSPLLFATFTHSAQHYYAHHLLTFYFSFITVRIMLSNPLFPSISLYLCKTSCPKHNIKLHNYALTITTTTHGTCLWSRYPVLVIIRELEVLTWLPADNHSRQGVRQSQRGQRDKQSWT